MTGPRPSEGLRNQVQQQAGADSAPVPAERGDQSQPSIYGLIDRQRNLISQILPKHMDAARLTKIIATTIRMQPKLLECTPVSLLGASMLSAQTGLEPGPLGECYWLPFWNRKAEWTDPETGRKRTGAFEVTWIMGYKGIMKLARNSGQLLSISSHVVYDKDEFSFSYGLDEHLHHVPADGDRGRPVKAWMLARFKDGGHYFRVMSVADIEKHRERSRAKDNGPWVTDWDAMACKTTIRASAPFLPLSIEVARALNVDETTQQGPISLEEAGFDTQPTPALTAATPAAEPDAATAGGAEAGDGAAAAEGGDDEPEYDPETGQPIVLGSAGVGPDSGQGTLGAES